MSAKSFLDAVFLTWFSRPKSNRTIYRAVRRQRCTCIVEVGIADVTRSQRLIQMAQVSSPSHPIRYTGIDRFEARPSDQPRLTLKQVHQALSSSGATVQLIPGEPHMALARHANHLGGTQLLIASEDFMAEDDGAWFYVPRMLDARSAVYLEVCSANQTSFRRVQAEEIDRRAIARQAA